MVAYEQCISKILVSRNTYKRSTLW